MESPKILEKMVYELHCPFRYMNSFSCWAAKYCADARSDTIKLPIERKGKVKFVRYPGFNVECASLVCLTLRFLLYPSHLVYKV